MSHSVVGQIRQKRPEAEVAKERHQRIMRTVARRRLRQAILAACFALFGGALAFLGFYMYAFWAVGVAAIFGIQFLDAHSHLQEIKIRPSHILVPRLFSPPAGGEGAHGTPADVEKPQQ